MSYLPMPKCNIRCGCGNIVFYIDEDKIGHFNGTMIQDDTGTYIVCKKCGRKVYIW